MNAPNLKINRQLNLVIPIDRGSEPALFVHSTPVASSVFKQYWEVVGRTMNALYSRGFGFFAPRYAAPMLREMAQASAGTDSQLRAQALDRLEKGFIAELRRLTNVLVLGAKGWEMVPLEDARSMDLIDEEEFDEVETAVIFFTCASRSHLKSEQDKVHGALSMWNARAESLDCTAFRNFLATSSVTASTGEKATA